MRIKQKAFTLIELLVTIVIIGVLSTISVATFNGYFVKAREAKRINQFVQMTDLFKLYVTEHGSLPAISGSVGTGCGGWYVVNKNNQARFQDIENNFGVKLAEDYFENCEGFHFYIYNAGSYGFSANKGRFLIFGTTIEQISSGDKTREDLGLGKYIFTSPSGRNWITKHSTYGYETNVVFGIFENGDIGGV